MNNIFGKFLASATIVTGMAATLPLVTILTGAAARPLVADTWVPDPGYLMAEHDRTVARIDKDYGSFPGFRAFLKTACDALYASYILAYQRYGAHAPSPPRNVEDAGLTAFTQKNGNIDNAAWDALAAHMTNDNKALVAAGSDIRKTLQDDFERIVFSSEAATIAYVRHVDPRLLDRKAYYRPSDGGYSGIHYDLYNTPSGITENQQAAARKFLPERYDDNKRLAYYDKKLGWDYAALARQVPEQYVMALYTTLSSVSVCGNDYSQPMNALAEAHPAVVKRYFTEVLSWSQATIEVEEKKRGAVNTSKFSRYPALCSMD